MTFGELRGDWSYHRIAQEPLLQFFPIDNTLSPSFTPLHIPQIVPLITNASKATQLYQRRHYRVDCPNRRKTMFQNAESAPTALSPDWNRASCYLVLQVSNQPLRYLHLLVRDRSIPTTSPDTIRKPVAKL